MTLYKPLDRRSKFISLSMALSPKVVEKTLIKMKNNFMLKISLIYPGLSYFDLYLIRNIVLIRFNMWNWFTTENIMIYTNDRLKWFCLILITAYQPNQSSTNQSSSNQINTFMGTVHLGKVYNTVLFIVKFGKTHKRWNSTLYYVPKIKEFKTQFDP